MQQELQNNQQQNSVIGTMQKKLLSQLRQKLEQTSQQSASRSAELTQAQINVDKMSR